MENESTLLSILQTSFKEDSTLETSPVITNEPLNLSTNPISTPADLVAKHLLQL